MKPSNYKREEINQVPKELSETVITHLKTQGEGA